jgi:hypothetical protein
MVAKTIVFVVTAHGYGHASRQMEVLRTLLSRRPDLDAAVLSAAPEEVFRDYLGADPAVSSRVRVVPHRADVGLVQRDGLSMDHAATLRALEACSGDPAPEALAAVLAPLRPALVVADLPPVAFPAAERLGVPSVGVGNFDWAWIYAHYGEAFAPWARRAAAWQARATLGVHLPPGPALTGFPRVVEAAPLARRLLADPAAIRARLALPPGERAVLASFGGFGLDDPDRRIPRVPGVTWILAPPMPDLGRADTRFVDREPYLGLLAACDAVYTKPGYGIVCEAARHRTRVLYTDRGDFPEYPFLVAWLHANAPAVHVRSTDLGDPAIVRAALERLFALPEVWAEGFDGAERVVDALEPLL